MSSILKRPASPGPSPSNSNPDPTQNHTAKRVKLEETLQDAEVLYDPDLDDSLARVGQVSASTESGTNLKEAKAEAEADVEVKKELEALLERPTGLDKLIALAVSPSCLPITGFHRPHTREAEPQLSVLFFYFDLMAIIRPTTWPDLRDEDTPTLNRASQILCPLSNPSVL